MPVGLLFKSTQVTLLLPVWKMLKGNASNFALFLKIEANIELIA